MTVQFHRGDALHVLATIPDESVDSIVTDPPYGLSREPDITEVLTHWLAGDDYDHGGGGFMGKEWDSFVPGPSVWKECLRVLKPGGHLVCFAGSRTVDLMGMSIRLAGFEIRDQIQWLYGSGFPKSLDVSKAIDKAAGAEREVVGIHRRHGGGSPVSGSMSGPLGTASELPLTAPATPEAEQWKGWGTALKPAHEPIILARKPFKGTVAKNVLEHGTGALNIDATRIAAEVEGVTDLGRWPANVIFDPEAGALLDEQSGISISKPGSPRSGRRGDGWGMSHVGAEYDDQGGASRFFYCAKTAKSERNAGLPAGLKNDHPTVKPVKLMEWLVKLVTPPGGTVLDPFCGSGTTLVAAERLGFDGIGVDRDDEDRYLVIAQHRVRHASELEYGAELPQPSPSPTTGAADDFGVVDLFPDA